MREENQNETGNQINTRNHDMFSVTEEKIITDNTTIKDVCNISAFKKTQNIFLFVELRPLPQLAAAVRLINRREDKSTF